ncbi:ABC transporter permease [Aneurinibacillus sp. Ricciae_BoGa-3]|uniref:ABC transporter permease n=1 Tax=Aneurinibacillus sp. Ricciae_BoGa-3 TaxID=3022697 RepID=UPI002340652D|nr:ABC transporter permease [Aneurinibacillus sp. Ricciae_BoGa-3]WCK53475.1 ABC transporter permease [Aneurinibacillus sp. Ricciae_BoGa-3]
MQGAVVTNADGVQQARLRKSSPWRDAWQRLARQKAAVIGLGVILLFILLGICAPLLSHYSWAEGKLTDRLLPPSGAHWFGTDDLGRDLFTRVLFGARISLWVGFSSVAGSIIVGTVLGLVAGYFGRWTDTIISRVFDIMLAFPSILLAIAIVTILGPSLSNALIAIAIVNIPTYGRLVRSRVLSIKEEEYIVAARVIGMKHTRILFFHVLPNSIAPVIVQGTLGVATAVLEAAALGFLGLGAQPPEPEWGKIIADSREYLATAWWTVLFPGVAIMLTVLGFNLFGDGLRDALDPKMKQ